MAGIIQTVKSADEFGPVTIEAERQWSFESVKSCCVRNNFFNAGDNAAYRKMLEHVDGSCPTVENIYYVARLIHENTTGQTIDNIMFCLEADAVHTFYEIKRGN